MNEKFYIRDASQSDWQDIIDVYNYYVENSSCNFEYSTYTVNSRLGWFELFSETSIYDLIVIEDDNNKIIGYAATTPFNSPQGYQSSVNISIYCSHQNRSNGIGSLLLTALLEKINKRPDIHRAYAGITIPNEPSLNLFSKFGFKQVAHYSEVGHKFNQYWDVVWLELRCL